MVIQPIYNILFLPDVTYHFKKEFFTENASEQLEVGSELLFAFLRNEDDAEELDADHICPVGISARVEAFGDDDSVQIRTLERVDLSDVEVENGQILADASIRAEVDDYTAEEEKAQFLRLRAALLKFVQGYQWGMWARSFILQRKNMYDLGSALSEYLNISPEEKYAIVETDSRRERCTLIEAAINEFMEVAKVSIVGAGMTSNPGVAAKMFEALYNVGININMISTSEIRITVLVKKKDGEKAMNAIHEAFFGNVD